MERLEALALAIQEPAATRMQSVVMSHASTRLVGAGVDGRDDESADRGTSLLTSVQASSPPPWPGRRHAGPARARRGARRGKSADRRLGGQLAHGSVWGRSVCMSACRGDVGRGARTESRSSGHSCVDHRIRADSTGMEKRAQQRRTTLDRHPDPGPLPKGSANAAVSGIRDETALSGGHRGWAWGSSRAGACLPARRASPQSDAGASTEFSQPGRK